MLVAGGASAGFCDGCCAGCFEGLISQALSSKPLASFSGGAGARAKGVSIRSLAFSSLASFSFNMLASTTSSLCTAGAGRPLRVLFLRAPPGPEKRPPPTLSGDVAPSLISALASSIIGAESFSTYLCDQTWYLDISSLVIYRLL